MTRYDFIDKIQGAFVEIVNARAEKCGFTKKEFACKIWPEDREKTSENRWNVLRNKSCVTGKPQSLLLTDAFRMADALNESAVYLIGLAAERAAVEAERSKDK